MKKIFNSKGQHNTDLYQRLLTREQLLSFQERQAAVLQIPLEDRREARSEQAQDGSIHHDCVTFNFREIQWAVPRGISFIKKEQYDAISPSTISSIASAAGLLYQLVGQVPHPNKIAEGITSVSIQLDGQDLSTPPFEQQWERLKHNSTNLGSTAKQQLQSHPIVRDRIQEFPLSSLRSLSVKSISVSSLRTYIDQVKTKKASPSSPTSPSSSTHKSTRRTNPKITEEKAAWCDQRAEKKVMRREVEQKPKNEIDIEIAVPHSQNSYLLNVNLESTGTDVTITKYTVKNGEVDSASWMKGYSNVYPNKFQWWMHLIFETSIIKRALVNRPWDTLAVIEENLTAWTWRMDKKDVLHIFRPDNGIPNRFKTLCSVLPIQNEETNYMREQENAIAGLKYEYNQTYAECISQGDTSVQANTIALNSCFRNYCKSILWMDYFSKGGQQVFDDYRIEKNWFDDAGDHKAYDRGGYTKWNWSKMRKFNDKDSLRWRTARMVQVQNLGNYAFTLSRQIHTGLTIYKIINQNTLPSIEITELQFYYKRKLLVQSMINGQFQKALNSADAPFVWHWKDLLWLDPYYLIRETIIATFNDLLRVTWYLMGVCRASRQAEKDVLITIIVIKLITIGLYNSETPHFIKRIWHHFWHIYKQSKSLVKNIHHGKTIHQLHTKSTYFLGKHQEISNLVATIHTDKDFKHFLYEHPKLEERWNKFRTDYHGVNPNHVVYEIYKDFKGPIAFVLVGAGYFAALIASIALCFWDFGCLFTRKDRQYIIKPRAPFVWFHHHEPFRDFFQDILVAIENIGQLMLLSALWKSYYQGFIKPVGKDIKQIHEKHLIFPSPSQWIVISFKQKFRNNSVFRTKVYTFLKTQLKLTALPTNKDKFMANNYFREKTVKIQVQDAVNEGKTDTFKSQASADIDKQYEKDPTSIYWSNMYQLQLDLLYYSEHKFRVKHRYTHMMTIYALNHIKGIVTYPIKLVNDIWRSVYKSGAFKAYTNDDTAIRMLEANLPLLQSSRRVQSLITAVRATSHISSWESSHKLKLQYFFNSDHKPTSNYVFGWEDYFLDGIKGSTKTKINQKIALNVNICYALINAFQSKTVQNYYDKHGLVRTIIAAMHADETLLSDLRTLNKTFETAVDRIHISAGQRVILKRYQTQFATEYDRDRTDFIRIKKMDNKLVTEVLNPRHMLSDIVLSLMVKKVFTTELTAKDLEIVADFCKPDSSSERQAVYYQITHPLNPSGRHCRLFYEAALFWDYLIMPSIRKNVSDQFLHDKKSGEFKKFWKNSKSRSDSHKTVYGFYETLSTGQNTLNTNLETFFASNYDVPSDSNKNSSHGFYHYHPHPYQYHNRVALLPFFLRLNRHWNNYVVKGKSFLGTHSIKASLYNGKLSGLATYINNKFNLNIAQKFPLTNKQIMTVHKLSKSLGIPPQQVLDDIYYDHLPDETTITEALEYYAQTHKEEIADIQAAAAKFGLTVSEFTRRMRMADCKITTFTENIKTEVTDAGKLRADLMRWYETLGTDEARMRAFLNNLYNIKAPSLWKRVTGSANSFYNNAVKPAVATTEQNLKAASNIVSNDGD